jgi:hypothetical protein
MIDEAGAEKKLEADKFIREVLIWIRKVDNPSPSLEQVQERVMPEGHHGDAARWLIDSAPFKDWSNLLKGRTESPESKRLLWVRGTYGTGKTTALYHAIMALRNSPDLRPGNQSLRVVPYFCTISAASHMGAGYDFLLRGLVSHLALLPDFRLSPSVARLYGQATSSEQYNSTIVVARWESLLTEMVEESADYEHIIFVVDALDECSEGKNFSAAEDFFYFMLTLMKEHSNVSVLCSSHSWTAVGQRAFPFWKTLIQTLDVKAEVTFSEMQLFIQAEIARRRRPDNRSVFCKSSLTKRVMFRMTDEGLYIQMIRSILIC